MKVAVGEKKEKLWVGKVKSGITEEQRERERERENGENVTELMLTRVLNDFLVLNREKETFRERKRLLERERE